MAEEQKFSDEQIMLLEQVTYIDADVLEAAGIPNTTKLDMSSGNLGDILSDFTDDKIENLRKQGDTKIGGAWASGEEWADIITALKKDEELSALEVVYSEPDEDNTVNLNVCYRDPTTHQGIITYKGTTGFNEWYDNCVGLTEEMTDGQDQAMKFYNTCKELTEFDDMIVAGHSKGANKAMYVTALDEDGLISKCVAMDGPGFSNEFLEANPELYAKNAKKIFNYAISTDFVHGLMKQIPDINMIFCQGYGMTDGGQYHSPNSFFQATNGEMPHDENGYPFPQITVTEEDENVKHIHEFLVFAMDNYPKEDLQEMGDFMGNITGYGLGNQDTNKAIQYILDNREKFDKLTSMIKDYAQVNNLGGKDLDKFVHTFTVGGTQNVIGDMISLALRDENSIDAAFEFGNAYLEGSTPGMISHGADIIGNVANEGLDELGNTVDESAEEAGAYINEGAAQVNDTITNAGTEAGAYLNGIGESQDGLWGAALDGFTDGLASIVEGTSDAVGNTIETAGDVLDVVVETGGDIVDGAADIIGDGANWVIDGLGDAASNAWSFGEGVYDWVTGSSSKEDEAASAALSSVVGGGVLGSAISSLTSGLASSVTSAVSSAVSAATEKVEEVAQTVQASETANAVAAGAEVGATVANNVKQSSEDENIFETIAETVGAGTVGVAAGATAAAATSVASNALEESGLQEFLHNLLDHSVTENHYPVDQDLKEVLNQLEQEGSIIITNPELRDSNPGPIYSNEENVDAYSTIGGVAAQAGAMTTSANMMGNMSEASADITLAGEIASLFASAVNSVREELGELGEAFDAILPDSQENFINMPEDIMQFLNGEQESITTGSNLQNMTDEHKELLDGINPESLKELRDKLFEKGFIKNNGEETDEIHKVKPEDTIDPNVVEKIKEFINGLKNKLPFIDNSTIPLNENSEVPLINGLPPELFYKDSVGFDSSYTPIENPFEYSQADAKTLIKPETEEQMTQNRRMAAHC